MAGWLVTIRLRDSTRFRIKLFLEDASDNCLDGAGSKSPPRIWDDFWVLQDGFTVGFTAWAPVAKALLVSGPEANSPPAKPEDGWAKREAQELLPEEFASFTNEP